MEKTSAIILRITEFSESSCVVTMFTREFGKITALAKGARRRKNPFEGALDLLSLTRIVFLHKKSDSMDLLTESKLERRFRSSAIDLNRFYGGLYVVELLSAMTDDNDPHVELFDLADEVIREIDCGNQVDFQLMRLEIGALVLLGHKPMLEQCVGCGQQKTIDRGRVDIGLRAGGIFCNRCRQGKKSVVSLSENAWKTLVLLAEFRNQSIESTSFNRGELRAFLNQYISHHLGHRPKLQKYLNSNN